MQELNYRRTFFVPNWNSEEATEFRQNQFTNITDSVNSFLFLSNKLKMIYSYTETVLLSYPEFIYVFNKFKQQYEKFVKEIETSDGFENLE